MVCWDQFGVHVYLSYPAVLGKGILAVKKSDRWIFILLACTSPFAVAMELAVRRFWLAGMYGVVGLACAVKALLMTRSMGQSEHRDDSNDAQNSHVGQ